MNSLFFPLNIIPNCVITLTHTSQLHLFFLVSPIRSSANTITFIFSSPILVISCFINPSLCFSYPVFPSLTIVIYLVYFFAITLISTPPGLSRLLFCSHCHRLTLIKICFTLKSFYCKYQIYHKTAVLNQCCPYLYLPDLTPILLSRVISKNFHIGISAIYLCNLLIHFCFPSWNEYVKPRYEYKWKADNC